MKRLQDKGGGLCGLPLQTLADVHPCSHLEHLVDQTQGDAALERQLLCLFRTQARAILSSLRDDSFASEQRKKDFAHPLKGAALAIGATHVAAMAAAYESLVAQSNRLPLSNVLSALQAATEEAMTAIDQRIGPSHKDD